NNPYIALRSELVRELLPNRHSRILDLGAGSGELSLPLLDDKNELVFVDASPGMLEIARAAVPVEARDRVSAICGDVLEVPLSGTFDLVLCVGLLAHVPEWERVLGRIASVLVPSGHALIQLTDAASLLGKSQNITIAMHNLLRPGSMHAHALMSL